MKCIKNLVLSSLLVLLSCAETRPSHDASSCNPNAVIVWYDFGTAVVSANEHSKKLLAYFYAPWCPWCEKMSKETLSDPCVAQYVASKYVATKINVDSDDIVNKNSMSLPTIMTYDTETNRLDKKIVGFKPPTEFVRCLDDRCGEP